MLTPGSGSARPFKNSKPPSATAGSPRGCALLNSSARRKVRRTFAPRRSTIPSPDDRSKLLAIGAELRHDVADVIGIVAPRTFSRWVEEQRKGRQPKSVGRPRVAKNVIELVKRIARENAGRGYERIVGELRTLRVRLSRTSVRTILKSRGFTLSPRRGGNGEETVWRKFLRLHMKTLVACGFFTKEAMTPLGV